VTISPGTHLGPYEIIAKLGEGGMGEVWRATDSKLGREVAVKLLPEGFADDPERHARFERKARNPGISQTSQHRDSPCPRRCLGLPGFVGRA
jgi:serine/threonine protein kinase